MWQAKCRFSLKDLKVWDTHLISGYVALSDPQHSMLVGVATLGFKCSPQIGNFHDHIFILFLIA